MTEAVIEASGVYKAYRRRPDTPVVSVLEAIDLAVPASSSVAIQGESGTGKTTLLNLLGGLDRPDRGELRHRGHPLPGTVDARARWRRESVGFIFQFHGLLREFSALENVALAGLIAGRDRKISLGEARVLLDDLGLAERRDHFPAELSGGEQQRVAIARALSGSPSLVLADEPTGNLDPATGGVVLDLLFELQAQRRFALVVATHSSRLAARCNRILRIEGRRLVEGMATPQDDLPPEGRMTVVS